MTTMIKQWELFEKVSGSRVARTMRVSLNERGAFSMNQKTFDELKQPKEVELYFDKINGLIGVKPVPMHTDFSYPVRKQGKNNSYLVRAMAFLTHYNIRAGGTVLFTAPMLEDGMLELDMAKTRPIGKNKPKADSDKAFVLGGAN